eukprot:801137-Prorocentrum_minimum.AAC.1
MNPIPAPLLLESSKREHSVIRWLGVVRLTSTEIRLYTLSGAGSKPTLSGSPGLRVFRFPGAENKPGSQSGPDRYTSGCVDHPCALEQRSRAHPITLIIPEWPLSGNRVDVKGNIVDVKGNSVDPLSSAALLGGALQSPAFRPPLKTLERARRLGFRPPARRKP